MTQTCPVCHRSKGIGDRFCTSCGHAFDPDPAAEPTAQPSPPDLKKLCVGCRTVNQAEATYCYRCGLNLPEATYPSMAGNPAGFWIRVAAYLMDEAIISLAAILLMNIFIGMDPNESVKQLVGASTGWEIPLSTMFAGAAYYTFAIGQWGQTVGKAIMGLKVTRADGSRLSFQRSFARYWAYLIPAIPLGLGFIAIALSSQKRGWHDLVCNTQVVNLRS